MLWDFEQALAAQSVPVAVNRGAYYLSNLDPLVEVVTTQGVLPSFSPADLVMPMVAPEDLGEAAAARLLSGVDDLGLRYVEGPDRWSFRDVADAFAAALGRDVVVEVTPPDQHVEAWSRLGYSPASAASFGAMSRESAERGPELPEHPIRGSTGLDEYIQALVSRAR